MRLNLLLTSAFALLVLAAPAAHANGLLVSNAPDGRRLPTTPGTPSVVLRSHRVNAELSDRVANVTVEQVFRNRTNRRLEGTYLFPLPEGATVSGFAMTMGGKMVEGEIIEAKMARSIYEGIVRRRRDPGLLEYVGRGLFRAKVFPIEPRGDVTIKMTFQQIVPEDGGMMEFRYPLATDRFHKQAVAEVVLDVRVESQADIRALYSPSHNVEVVRAGARKARVSYEGSGRRQTRDFLLYIGRSAEAVAFSCLSHKPASERGTFLSIFAPPLTVPTNQRAPKDVIYVLDTSGSMKRDGKIDQARRALDYGVNVLAPGDRFNIVTFATGIRAFREGLIDASQDARAQASQWIAGIEANGGTDIGSALAAALDMGRPSADGRKRLLLIVLLSDGKPTVGVRDRNELVKTVEARNKADARVFTFGVGFDLDVELLDRIAEATHGTRDYVAPQQELEVVTSRFFTKVNHPVMTGVTIDFGDGISDVFPRTIRDLFAGSQIHVFGRYETPGPRTIRLRGRLAGADVTYEYKVDFAGRDALPYLPRLWAHRKVAFLIDDMRLHGETKEVVDEVVRLATRFAIVTPYTSGLVVEDDELDGRRWNRASAGLPAPRTADRGVASGRGGGGGGRFRGPGGSVPPGMREPTDATPPPPAPPSGPPTTPSTPTTPGGPAPSMPTTPSPAGPATPSPERSSRDKIDDSKRLKEMKDRAGGGQEALEHEQVKTAADKTFVNKHGVWIDSLYDPEKHKQKVEVEAWSAAWLELMKKDKKIAKYLALGEDVIFLWNDKVYVVTKPASDK